MKAKYILLICSFIIIGTSGLFSQIKTRLQTGRTIEYYPGTLDNPIFIENFKNDFKDTREWKPEEYDINYGIWYVFNLESDMGLRVKSSFSGNHDFTAVVILGDGLNPFSKQIDSNITLLFPAGYYFICVFPTSKDYRGKRIIEDLNWDLSPLPLDHVLGNIELSIEVYEVRIPSQNQNYIHTRTYTNTESDYLSTIQYYDGLGRPNQNSQVGVSPGGSDLISLQQYDDIGRESKSWLPAPISGNGTYIENVSTKIQDYYKDLAYSYPVYEASPLNRVLEQYGPGKDWHPQGQISGKSVKTAYKTNTASGDLACYKFKVNGSGESTSLAKDNYYANGSLYVTEMKDEDNKVSYEFKDKLGQVVLTRQMDKTDPHDTYYIYDDFGNLSYVLPPMLSDAIIKNGKAVTDIGTEMKQFAYIYKYDQRNRCIKKKLPGCDQIYYVYDKADRLIYSQDGEQRKQGKWSYIKYDAFGRVILTGENKLKNSTPSQESLHKQLRDKYQNIVAIESAVLGRSNVPPFGYTLSTLNEVTDLDAVQIVNHYDDYSHLLDQEQLFRDHLDYNEKSGYGKRYWDTNLKSQSAKGLLTGTRVKHADDYTKEVVTAFYYDERGRVIQTKSTNHMGGVDKEYIAYNFTGQPVKKLVEHTGNYLPSGNQLNEEYTYSYDHAGRLLTTIRNGETIESLAYNELGQLAGKTQGEELANTYEYNIRGWMKKHKENQTKFEQLLLYSNNGNISTMEYVQDKDTRFRSFYEYDGLNRLTASTIQNLNNSLTGFERLKYDKNGNVIHRTAFSREPAYINDELDILYKGNQLSNLINGALIQGYTRVSYPGKNGYFNYNSNGSLISDSGRGIATIQYNSLNLPKLIQFNNGNQIQYTYASDGQKLRAKHITAKQGVVQPITNGQIRELKPSQILSVLQNDYVDNIILTSEGGSEVLELIEYKVLIPGGYKKYVLPKSGITEIYDRKPYYQLTDYLGNIRSTKVKGQALEVTEYHAFGTPFRRDDGQMSSDPYKFGGKEFDRMHGLNWYDFHARQYDPVLARFHTMDPLAEKYYNISPYAYCANNPVRNVDPTGMDWYRSQDGNAVMWRNGSEESYTQTLEGDEGSITIEYKNIGSSHVTSSMGVSLFWEQNQLIGIAEPKADFIQKKLSFFELLSQSDNFLSKLAYNISNDFYVSAQPFTFDILGESRINELTGGGARSNLDGTTNYESVGSFINVLSATFGTMAQKGATEIGASIPKGLFHVDNVSKKGLWGGVVNWGIKNYNSLFSKGQIVKQAKSLNKKD